MVASRRRGAHDGPLSPSQSIWSSIEGPLATELDASLSVLGFVFTRYVVLVAPVKFPAGWWRDGYGQRKITLGAGILAGSGHCALAFAGESWPGYLACAVGSLGVDMVYMVAVNTAVTWFPHRRD